MKPFKESIFFPKISASLHRELSTTFLRHGYILTSSPEKAQIIFHTNEDSLTAPYKRNFLLLIEPRCVEPKLYAKECLSKFELVVPWGPYRAQKMDLPVWLDLPVEVPSNLEESLRLGTKPSVMVNASKYSSVSESQYSLRRRTLILDANKQGSITLYGDHWNEPLHSEARRRVAACRKNSLKQIDWEEAFSEFGKRYKQHDGKINPNFDGVTQFRTAIVIENESDFLSEKVWHFLFRGVVPIYVGPDLRYDDELKQCLLQSESSPEIIMDLVLNTMDSELITMRKRFSEFTKLKSFQRYLPKDCAEQFVERLVRFNII